MPTSGVGLDHSVLADSLKKKVARGVGHLLRVIALVAYLVDMHEVAIVFFDMEELVAIADGARLRTELVILKEMFLIDHHAVDNYHFLHGRLHTLQLLLAHLLLKSNLLDTLRFLGTLRLGGTPLLSLCRNGQQQDQEGNKQSYIHAYRIGHYNRQRYEKTLYNHQTAVHN